MIDKIKEISQEYTSSKGVKYCKITSAQAIESDLNKAELEKNGFKYSEQYESWTFWGSKESIGKPKEEIKRNWNKVDQTESIQKMTALKNAVSFCDGKSLEEVVKTARTFLNFLREE